MPPCLVVQICLFISLSFLSLINLVSSSFFHFPISNCNDDDDDDSVDDIDSDDDDDDDDETEAKFPYHLGCAVRTVSDGISWCHCLSLFVNQSINNSSHWSN